MTGPGPAIKRLKAMGLSDSNRQGDDKGVRLHAGHTAKRGWRAKAHDLPMEHLALTKVKPKSAPSSVAATPFLIRKIWGSWRPRFLLCYLSPSRVWTAWPSGIICRDKNHLSRALAATARPTFNTPSHRRKTEKNGTKHIVLSTHSSVISSQSDLSLD